MTEPATPSASARERRERRDDARAPLRAIAEAVQDAIVCADAEGHVTLWLGGAERLFGWPAEEIVGRSITELVPQGLRDEYGSAFRRAVAGEERFPLGGRAHEVVALRGDGSEFPAELTLSRGSSAGSPLFVGIVRDITYRRAAEARLTLAQERFRSAFEHAATGMTMASPDGRFIATNEAFRRLVGRSEAELASVAFSDITHPADQEADLHLVARLLSGEADHLRVDKRYLRPDGTSVYVEGNVSLVRDEAGAPSHFLTQVIDVTVARETAAELERSNAELAQLASVAAHDLNEPLRIVDGFLRLLEGRAGEGLDDEGRRFVAEALAGAERMRDLIDALLRYARAGSAEVRREPVDLATVARQAEGALAAMLWERGTTVRFDDLPVVHGDAALIRQILQNLLANAMRHARPDDPQVSVGARRVDGAWEISIADNGPGFPEELRATAFDLFVRGRGGGTGLGLAICRRAVERHGGRIWIAPATAGGADVRFTLPVAEG